MIWFKNHPYLFIGTEIFECSHFIDIICWTELNLLSKWQILWMSGVANRNFFVLLVPLKFEECECITKPSQTRRWYRPKPNCYGQRIKNNKKHNKKGAFQTPVETKKWLTLVVLFCFKSLTIKKSKGHNDFEIWKVWLQHNGHQFNCNTVAVTGEK